MILSPFVNVKRKFLSLPLLPTVACLDGEYGEKDICMGVPAVLGCDGMERVIELDLNKSEKAQFSKSVGAIRKDLAKLNI